MFVTRFWNFSVKVNHEWTRMNTNFGACTRSTGCRLSLLKYGEGRVRVAPSGIARIVTPYLNPLPLRRGKAESSTADTR